ncbi:MAG: hypothetical protein ACM359_06200 [Bacillota bacterium]
MTGSYIVQIDLEQLRARRSRIEQRVVTQAEVELWLTQYGFYPRIDGLYLAEGPILSQLQATEILDMRPVETMTL